MSQHHFFTLQAGVACHINIGWDRVLHYHFMVMEKEEDCEHPFFSNLLMKEARPDDLVFYLIFLERFGIELPFQMVTELYNDKQYNIGNKEVIHTVRKRCYRRYECNSQSTNLKNSYTTYQSF